MKTLWRKILQDAECLLLENAVPEPKASVEFILSNILGCKRKDLIFFLDEPADKESVARFESLVARRLRREPIQYILGEWDFMGMSFKLDSAVFIPRPETEVLVEKAVEIIGGKSKAIVGLDIGVGCGNIILSVLRMTKGVFMFGCDINEKAIELSYENASRLGVNNCNFELVRADIFDEFPMRFDIILSNPPYVSSDFLDFEAAPELKFEPREALDGGRDGLKFIRRIMELANELLYDDGVLLMEFGDGQQKEIKRIARNYFSKFELIRDHSGLPRVFWGIK